MNISSERVIGFNVNVVFPESGYAQKPVIPEVAEMLRRRIANSIKVYGITDRSDNELWIQNQLEKAGISPAGLHRTPIADFIKQLGITDYYESDKETILRLAKSFPKVSFNLINHRLDHLRNQSLPANVWVIPSGALTDYPYNHT